MNLSSVIADRIVESVLSVLIVVTPLFIRRMQLADRSVRLPTSEPHCSSTSEAVSMRTCGSLPWLSRNHDVR
jgi:hypothetical protein